jgi:hypothetical protein
MAFLIMQFSPPQRFVLVYLLNTILFAESGMLRIDNIDYCSMHLGLIW